MFKNESFENIYNTNNLKIEKKVTGSQGDKKKDFNFEVTVNGAAGETYTLIKSGGRGAVSLRLTQRPIKKLWTPEKAVPILGGGSDPDGSPWP